MWWIPCVLNVLMPSRKAATLVLGKEQLTWILVYIRCHGWKKSEVQCSFWLKLIILPHVVPNQTSNHLVGHKVPTEHTPRPRCDRFLLVKWLEHSLIGSILNYQRRARQGGMVSEICQERCSFLLIVSNRPSFVACCLKKN